MRRRSSLGIVVVSCSLVLVAAVAPLVLGQRSSGPEQAPAVASEPTVASREVSPKAEPGPLRPNLRGLPAVPTEIETDGGERRLRFAASLSNVGDGPLELVPDEATSCPAGQRHVVQAIYHDGDGDRVFRARRDR